MTIVPKLLQVDCGLRDHFATTSAYLWAICALSMAFRFQIFVPLYYIVLPYLRHFGSYVLKLRRIGSIRRILKKNIAYVIFEKNMEREI